jgi:GABA permease
MSDHRTGGLVVDIEVAGGEAQYLHRLHDCGAVLCDHRSSQAICRDVGGLPNHLVVVGVVVDEHTEDGAEVLGGEDLVRRVVRLYHRGTYEVHFVVLTAVLSCLNSGLYTASRMLFVLAARNKAPERLLKLNRKGVPAWAILFSTVVGFLCAIAAAVSPDRVFLFLLNSSGAIILFVYLLIGLSQLRMRRMVPPERLVVKMWLYPVLTVLTAAAIVAVLIAIGLGEDTRSQLILSLLAWAVVLIVYAVRRRVIGDAHLSDHGVEAEKSADPWMHEHISGAEGEVDAVVGEGPLDPDLIRRAREEGYANEAP